MQKKKIPPEILKKILLFALFETVVAAVLVAVDLLSKHFVFQSIELGDKIETLGGFLTITAVENTGASFGIFGSSTVALTIVSFVCSILIYAFSIYTERTRTPLLRAALILVLAGAVGNLIDRLFLGCVRDFIQLSIFPWVFNIADSYLTVGVILLLIYVVFFYTRDKERADKRKAAEGAPGGVLTAEGLTQADSGAEDENGSTPDGKIPDQSERGSESGPKSKKADVEPPRSGASDPGPATDKSVPAEKSADAASTVSERTKAPKNPTGKRPKQNASEAPARAKGERAGTDDPGAERGDGEE